MEGIPLGPKPALKIQRHYKASPERVWQAWTDPQALKAWFAPTPSFEVPLVEADLRVGGRYRIVMRAPDGELHDVRGVYREVQPPIRLVYTWAWVTTPERESLVTLQLRAALGGTELTLVHEQFFDEPARDRHHKGWNGCLDRLQAHLAST
jgi:uncharacterized protein YndB with AHSA1/START domain